MGQLVEDERSARYFPTDERGPSDGHRLVAEEESSGLVIHDRTDLVDVKAYETSRIEPLPD